MSLPSNAGIHMGSNWGPLMASGNEWWRLFSYNFVHVGGAIHIGFNLYALAIVGPLVERWYGPARATVIYVGSGVLGGVASHLWDPAAVSGGASGAVLGLIGAGVAAGHLSGTTAGLAMRRQLFRWFVFIVLFGLIMRGIDNAAHIGGFVAGAALGLGLSKRQPSMRERAVFRVLAGALAALCVYSMAMAWWTSRDIPWSDSASELLVVWDECTELLETERPPAEVAPVCERTVRASLWGMWGGESAREMGVLATLWTVRLYEAAGESARAANIRRVFYAMWGTTPELVAAFEADSANLR